MARIFGHTFLIPPPPFFSCSGEQREISKDIQTGIDSSNLAQDIQDRSPRCHIKLISVQVRLILANEYQNILIFTLALANNHQHKASLFVWQSHEIVTTQPNNNLT